MPVIRSFRQLEVWRVSMDLATAVYTMSETLPVSERFGLTSQLRRAATSIPANLAEGHGRTTRSYAYHVGVAVGSQAELDTLLELAERLKYVSPEALEYVSPEALAAIAPRLAETGRMLHGLAGALRNRTETVDYRIEPRIP